MTEARYDMDGKINVVRDMYEVDFDPRSSKEQKFQRFTEVTKQKEESLTNYVKSQGGKVISVHSEPINKRRYKRNVAKLKKKEEKYHEYTEFE